MLPTHAGSFRFFRLQGIQVYVHWSWFLVAAFEVTQRARGYSSLAWNAVEYGVLFGIVLVHEFGHALACRQVGGQADQIVLWPLGGVAYVMPPPRPGATLWSIAAGPLVNLVLLVPLTLLVWASQQAGWEQAMPDAYGLARAVWLINLVLLLFNLLPVYPLDGGQILRALLWFVMGRARSLLVAAVIGLAGSAGLVLLAVGMRSVWIGILAAFMVMNCWKGLQQGLALGRAARAPRHTGWSCPGCGAAPPLGEVWVCGACQTRFDTFVTNGSCPKCGLSFPMTACPECGAAHPLSEWQRVAAG